MTNYKLKYNFYLYFLTKQKFLEECSSQQNSRDLPRDLYVFLLCFQFICIVYYLQVFYMYLFVPSLGEVQLCQVS